MTKTNTPKDKANAYASVFNTAAHTHARAPIIPNRVGRAHPSGNYAVYAKCQYTTTIPPAHDGAPHTIVHCTDRAIMMPGYYRACPNHILPILRRSLLEYANRDAAASDPPDTLERVAQVLDALHSLDNQSE